MSVNKISLVPTLTGILLIIGLLTPAIGFDLMGMGMHVWIWGLVYAYVPGDSILDFTDNPDLLGLSVVCTIMFLISIIFYFISANKMKNGRIGVGRLTAISSILLFFALIIYLGGVSVILDPGMGYSLWDVMNAGAAVILSFIALIIGIIGGYIYVKNYDIYVSRYEKRSSDIEALIKRTSSLSKTFTGEISSCSLCGTKIVGNVEYCPQCGRRIVKTIPVNEIKEKGSLCNICGTKIGENMKFCPECGRNIEKK